MDHYHEMIVDLGMLNVRVYLNQFEKQLLYHHLVHSLHKDIYVMDEQIHKMHLLFQQINLMV